jgi:hypothetical protein
VKHGRLFLSAVAAASCLWIGCSSSAPQRRFFPTGGELVELNILTTPVGIDLDGRPGIDGFSVKIYGNVADNPKPVPIRSGTMEVLMFDGTLYGRTNLPPPLHVWSFTASELRMHEFSAPIGIGYDLSLAWASDVPTRRLITVGARYTSAEGKVITSSLSSVTVLNK